MSTEGNMMGDMREELKKLREHMREEHEKLRKDVRREWHNFLFFLIAIAVGTWLAVVYTGWTKPTCRAGYVPSHTSLDGWACTPGYKP